MTEKSRFGANPQRMNGHVCTHMMDMNFQVPTTRIRFCRFHLFFGFSFNSLFSELCIVGTSRIWADVGLRLVRRQHLDHRDERYFVDFPALAQFINAIFVCSFFCFFIVFLLFFKFLFAENGQWEATHKFHAHQIGVNALSWAPAVLPSASILSSPNAPANPSALSAPLKRLVSGGSDNLVRAKEL